MVVFQGQRAVITGAASGLGRALAHALAAQGARLWLADIDEVGVRQVAEALAAGGSEARGIGVDVRDGVAMQALVDGVVAEAGGVDLMINNAGVGLAGEVADCDGDELRRVVDVNLGGVINGIAAAYPAMAAAGAGTIVNMASVAGLMPVPLIAAYSASKHAVVALSLALRMEATPRGVDVIVACPGWVDTAIYRTSPLKGWVRPSMAESMLGRVGALTPERCAAGILRGIALKRSMIIVPRSARVGWYLYRASPLLWGALGERGIALGRRLFGGAGGGGGAVL